MYFCLLWPLLVLNNTCLAVGSMVVPLPTPTHRHMWSRKKRRFFSDGLGCGTSVRDAARRGQDPAAGAAVTACRWDSSRSPRGPSGPARSSCLFLGSTREPARAQVNQRPTVSGSQSRHNLQGRCPSTEECSRARLVPRPSSPPGGVGPRAGRPQGRMRGVHTSLGTSLPQLEHIHSHCKQAENCLLEAVPKLSPVPPGIQGLTGLPFLPSC